MVIYVHNQFNANNITAQLYVEHTGWDYLCLEISHQKPNSKKYLLSNIYRLPNEIVQDVNTFTDEFSLYLSLLKRRKHSSFVCGDSNINLLSLDNKRHVNHFFETVMVKCFFPSITLPTRIQNDSRTKPPKQYPPEQNPPDKTPHSQNPPKQNLPNKNLSGQIPPGKTPPPKPPYHNPPTKIHLPKPPRQNPLNK